jgi:hypothetical protein
MDASTGLDAGPADGHAPAPTDGGGGAEATVDGSSEAESGGTQAPDAGHVDACAPTALACDGTAHACDGVIDKGCPNAITLGAPGQSQILGGTIVQQASTAFSSPCPTGQVLVGVGGSTGSWMDAIDAVCGIVELATDTTTVPYTYSVTISVRATLPTAGTIGSSDALFSARCPPNQAVMGIAGTSGVAMDHIVLSCAPLTLSGSPGSFALHQGSVTTLASVGDTGGGSPFTPLTCPDPSAITLISGYAGQWLGELGVACAIPSLDLIQ